MLTADHVAARSKAWTAFARSNAGIVGSNPTQGMDICMRLFCVCVALCVGSGLASGWSPVQGVLPTVYRIKKLKKRPRSNKTNVEPYIDVIVTFNDCYLWIYLWLYSPCRPWPLFQFLNPYTVGRTLGRGISPSQGRYLHMTTQTQNKRTQTSMPRVGFEPTITVFERTKTVHVLGCAATVIGLIMNNNR
jgi:hypothetical protein